MSAPRRPGALRVTLLNQFFPPDVAPTAHLSASLAGHLAAQGHRVTVLTGGEGYADAPGEARERPDLGVDVIGLWTPALGRGSVGKRLADYFAFLVGATVRLARLPRQDVIISLTTPPFVVVAAVVHKLVHRRTRVVLWSMDCYPDVIERLGSRTAGPSPATAAVAPGRPRRRLRGAARRIARPLLSLRRGGPASRLLRAVNRRTFRRLDHVVALDQAMADLLIDGYGSADRRHPPVSVIPNWEAVADFPAPGTTGGPTRWSGYDHPALAHRFVVLYLGNLGFGHRVETVVDAAATLGPDEGVAWLFMGGGARWQQLAHKAARAGHDLPVVQRPYVPKEETAGVMAGAGCALIVLADEALGVMSPSKLHANLAAGLPIVYVGPPGSNVDHAISRFGCGVSLRTGDRDGLVAAVRRLRDDDAWRAELSGAARRAFETAYCDRATLPQWDQVVGPPAARAC